MRHDVKHRAVTAHHFRATHKPCTRHKDHIPNVEKLLQRKNFLNPKETLYAVIELGATKAHYSVGKLIVLGILASMYVAVGATTAMIVSLGHEEGEISKGMQKLAYGAVFPVGLILVLIMGGELITGNMMTFLPPFFVGRISGSDVMRNWSIVYSANFFGSLASSYILVYLAGFFNDDPYHHALIHYAEHKIELGFYKVFLRGITCNFLVCLASFISNSCFDITSKIFATYFPALAFATVGFEHSVANMIIVSLAMMEGADISIGEYIGLSVIPSSLGNLVGGGIFVGMANWYVHTGGLLFPESSALSKHPHSRSHKKLQMIPISSSMGPSSLPHVPMTTRSVISTYNPGQTAEWLREVSAPNAAMLVMTDNLGGQDILSLNREVLQQRFGNDEGDQIFAAIKGLPEF
eukprot:TRINITY_DN462_c0_g1_i2.p1 TRINITY_DN462_c0_g1~~TRINITY_DN462_c0_g1_i2.p1  ORF type:complete len:408 (+),score=89.03 TRINITY_DN462_c0_g1_i2:68-1291(+)